VHKKDTSPTSTRTQGTRDVVSSITRSREGQTNCVRSPFRGNRSRCLRIGSMVMQQQRGQQQIETSTVGAVARTSTAKSPHTPTLEP
jgi:hypothetical protein